MDYEQAAHDILFNHKKIAFENKTQLAKHKGKINKAINELVMNLSLEETAKIVSQTSKDTISYTMSEQQTKTLITQYVLNNKDIDVKKARLVDHKTTREIMELIPGSLIKFVSESSLGNHLTLMNKELPSDVVAAIARRQTWEARREKYGESGIGHKVIMSAETKKRQLENFRKTNMERYGVPYPAQNKKVRAKQLATTKERYGSELLFNTDYFDKKKREFNATVGETTSYNKSYQAKFNFVTWEKTDKTLVDSKEQALDTLFDETKLVEFIDKNFPEGVKRPDLAKALGLAMTSTNRYIRKYDLGDRILVNREDFENEVHEYIESITGSEIQMHIRPEFMENRELDMYIPDYKVAIECNGEFFHSNYFPSKDSAYHKSKMTKTREQGINLVMIWETDWNDPVKQSIIKSQLAYKLHTDNIKRLYARKLTVKQVDNDQYKDFMNRSHLQGTVGASVKLGLFDKGTLYAVMSFGKTDRFHNQEYELKRYASLPFTTVVGGVSKLLHYFVTNYSDSILSYTDNDFALTNAVYSQVGFTKIGQTDPGYYWYNNGIKVSRQQAQKKRLPALADKLNLDELRPEDTEKSYMKRNKFNQVFNTGNDIYIYDK